MNSKTTEYAGGTYAVEDLAPIMLRYLLAVNRAAHRRNLAAEKVRQQRKNMKGKTYHG